MEKARVAAALVRSADGGDRTRTGDDRGNSKCEALRLVWRSDCKSVGLLNIVMPPGKRILLVIGGGIAAYKSLDLVRRLKERGCAVRAVMTRAAQEFVTPLSVSAITGERVFTDLFDLAAEFDVGHIRLSREAD